VFWIASMTKAITGAACMQLVEQGKLQLDQPMGKLVPGRAPAFPRAKADDPKYAARSFPSTR
jgi:CubicO group peptidase (beta-lactamase class C family)